MTDAHLWDRMAADLRTLGPLQFADLAQDATFEAMAARALETAPERFDVIGFSMGGYVAREMIAQAPDRVRRLVLIGTSARANTAAFDARNRAAVKAVRTRGFTGLSRQAILRAIHPDRRDDDALFDHIQAMARRLGLDVFTTQLLVPRADGRASLKAIGCPTMVVSARQDELRTLAESEELAAGIPDARLDIIEECGHMVPLERPDALFDLLRDFLA